MKKSQSSSPRRALATGLALASSFLAGLLLFPDEAALGQTRGAREVPSRSVDTSDRVAERYKKILLNSPSEGAALDQVYRSAVRKDGCESLIAELTAAVENETGETKGKRSHLLGLIYLRQNEIAKGLEALAVAEELLPNEGSVSVSRGDALILQGRLREGVEALARALEKNLPEKESLATLERLGATLARLGEREKAEAIWDRAVERFGESPEALRSIADAEADAGLYRKADELYGKLEEGSKARKDAQAEVEFAVARGDVKIRLGDKEGAIEDFERALDKLEPSHWLYVSVLDRVEYAYALRSDYDGLAERYRARLTKRPGDVEATRRLVVALGSLSRYAEAEEALAKARARDPKNVELIKSGIELALAQNRFVEADALYEELDAEAPGDLDVALAWGGVALKNDSLDAEARAAKAVEIWTRALADESTTIVSRLLIADKLSENNFCDEAEKVLRDAIELAPEDFEIRSSLVRLYFQEGEEDRGLADLERAREESGNDPDVLDKIASLLRSVGRVEEGVGYAREASSATPGDFRRAVRLCELESEIDGSGSEETVRRIEELASTQNERDQALQERLKRVERLDAVPEYLAELDAAIAIAKPEELAELYWKKTVCALTVDDPNGAADAAREALERDAISDSLRAKIPEIVAKSQSPDGSLELLNLALAKDPSAAGTYLRSKARVCLELGLGEEAIEASRRLFELESGSPESARALAEVLLETGRVDEAIATLHQSAESSGADRATRLKLASVLDESGETTEAIEVLWGVFDQGSRLEEKLTLIDSLSKLSAKADRFDALKERLRASAKTSDARRESAYCLARAYMSIKDYESARSTLENAVAFMGTRTDDSTFWLRALSNLAELQNDIEGAIRFQERLCELEPSETERSRLLTLYRRTEDPSRARDYLVREILPNEPLWKRLETVDALLSVEDYELAIGALNDIERTVPNGWEVLARRLTIAGLTSDPNLSELIARVEKRPESWDSKSSKTLALERDAKAISSTIAGDAWSVGGVAGRAVVQLVEPKDFRDLAAQTMTVVYRDKLALDEKTARSLTSSSVRPQKPVPSYLNFGATKLEALALKERLEGESPIPPLDGDASALKTRYALLSLRLLAREAKLVEEDDAAERLETERRATALALCERDPCWRVEAFPSVLEDLELASDAATIERGAKFLAETLSESLAANRLKDDATIWKLATNAARALESKGRADDATKVRELLRRASERDYEVLLSDSDEDALVPFEALAQTWRSIEAEVARQIRNKSDVERARETLGAALEARLARETREAFKGGETGLVERLLRCEEIGRTLCDKVSFGRTVLNSFANLDRRDLLEFDDGLSIDQSAAKDFEERVYRVLGLALESGRELSEPFAAKEGTGSESGVAFSTSEALGFLARDGRPNFNMAAYLVDKTLYGRPRPRDLAESSGVFERALGALFALDVASEAPERRARGEFAFDRLERFESRVAETFGKSEEFESRLYASKLRETSRALKEFARGEVDAETPDELKEKIEGSLSGFEKRVSDASALYVARAMLAALESDGAAELEAIERIRCIGFSDVKARELAILGAFKNASDARARERVESAIQTLSGARLDEKEGFAFWTRLVELERKEEAVKIRRRLESIATSFETVDAILDDLLERAKSSEVPDDADVAFAVRVFRTPSTSLGDGGRLAELRAKALLALDASGKLGSTLERLETQIAEAPGAYETALRLADLQIKLGRPDAARERLLALAERAPNDPGVVDDLALALAKVGETDKSKSLLKELYAKRLDEFFKQGAKPEFWTIEDDIAFIDETKTEDLAPRAFNVFSTLTDALLESREKGGSDEIYAAIERFWNREGVEPEAREALRASGARLLARTEDPRFFAPLANWVVESLEPSAAEGLPYQDVHKIVLWSDREPTTLSTSILDLANKERDADALANLTSRIDSVCEALAKRGEPVRARESGALVFGIMLRLKRGRFADALDALKKAEAREAFCAPEFPNDPLALCLGFEKYASSEERAGIEDVLFKYYSKSAEVNVHSVYEPFHVSRLYPLGIRSADESTREKYCALARKKLRETLRLAAKADLTSDRRVGGSTETVETIALCASALSDAFLSVGRRDVVRETIEETGLKARLETPDPDALEAWKELFAELKTKISNDKEGASQ